VGRFLVTNYGDSAASSIGVPEGVDTGAIHLQFCRCKQKTRNYTTRGIGDESKGTAIGERETVKFKSSDLLPGEPIEFLTIRYDR